ncbi:MAG: glyoxylate/hydroxypyruvate reductase A [Paracoccaceae bacterium]
MAVQIYFAAGDRLWPEYKDALPRALAAAGIDVEIRREPGDPSTVDYVVFAPGGDIADFAPFTGCKAVLNLWAGVERIVGLPSLTQPLARMVNHELTEGMVEYVVGHVLRHHLGMDAHIHGQDGIWRNDVLPPLARERPVTVLGLGALGQAAAHALTALNFPVTGWSRTQKAVDGIECLSEDQGLRQALARAQILVLLLPLTEDTRNLMNAERLALLPPGAFIVNPGRGPLIDDDALIAALNSGNVGHATLDVFLTEPLPSDHPFWAHPRVTVTPHIAADTRPDSAASMLAENVRRGEAGEPFLNLVDYDRGY